MAAALETVLKQTEILVRRARLRLIWERYIPTLAPALLALSLFILGAWIGLWQWIGDPVRLIALIITLVIIGRALYRARSIRFPSRSDARRRVETDSGQSHRPLDVLEDRPALSADVWPAHQQTALDQTKFLSKAQPRPALSPIDPAYLRYALPVLLLIAAVFMAGFSFDRFRQALSPSWQSPIRSANISYEAWIDPPAYTGRPPIYFKDKSEFSIPAGSEFVSRISGSSNAPRPRFQQGWRSRFLKPKKIGAKSFEVREIIETSSTIEFRVGFSRKRFKLTVTDDLAPDVEILEPPTPDKRDRLVLTYSLKDDFGVERLDLEMALLTEDTTDENAFDGATVKADIPLPRSAQKDVERGSSALDLSKNRWAGKKAVGRLIATDGAGNQGVSELTYFTIPDKIFVEPLAKAIAEQRGLVMAGLDKEYAPRPDPEWTKAHGFINENKPHLRFDRAPAEIQRATLLIEAITDLPSGYFEDPAVFMGLRHARSAMRHADEIDFLSGLPEDLWKIAIRAEFGVLGSALEEMREAEQALREGIARRAPQREIDALFERYNLAVEAYTEELRRKALEEGNTGEGGEGGGGNMGSVDEIQELLKAIEEANAAGDTEGARRALAQLAELLENMQIQLAQGGGGEGGESSEGSLSEELRENLEDLADLTGRQRDLQDETEQAERGQEEDGQDEEDGEDGDDNEDGNDREREERPELTPEELAQRQSELRDLLDQLDGIIPGESENGDRAQESQSGQSGQAGEQGQGGQGGQEGAQSGQPSGQGETGEGQSGQGENGEGQSGQGQAQAGQSGSGTEQGEGRGGGRSTQDLQDQLANGLGAAGQAMERSEDALENGDLGGAAEAQSDAIQALRQAGEALAEAAQRESGQDGENGGSQQGEGEGQDPLGRSDNGFNDGNSEADIDDRDNATRSRELLEELRRRAAEQDRKEEERKYLERLLKRF